MIQHTDASITAVVSDSKNIYRIGELAVMNFFDAHNVEYTYGFRFKQISYKRYEFYFEHEERKYLLEFDDDRHFNPSLHDNTETFMEFQRDDIMETFTANSHGYCMIRIDHTEVYNTIKHLERAFNKQNTNYFSNPIMYSYILNIWNP